MGGIMRRIGILGAMELEIAFLKEIMEIEEVVEYAGFNFYVGSYGYLKLFIVESGIGKVNAACCTQTLITKFNVSHIINYGIAGSLRPDIRICDIVIGHSFTYHDVGKSQLKNMFPFKERFYADEYLERIAIDAFSQIELKECNYHLGLVVTGDEFISNPSRRQNIVIDNNGCCVDMEAAAIAHSCFFNKVPFISIKCVSGNYDEDSTEYNTELDHIAAYSAARFTIKILNILEKH